MSAMFCISVYDPSGRIQEAYICNGRCYGKNSAKTDCICQGHNRGVGKAQAIENTQEWVQVWYQDWIDAHRGDYVPGWSFMLTYQLALPVHIENIRTPA